MRSYLEVPLRVQGGAVIGSDCVVHTEPREFSKLDIKTLDEIGGCIVDHLELLRIKQDHERAQHLIAGLGNIVAGSLGSPSSDHPPLQSMQNSRGRPRLNAFPSGTVGSPDVSNSITSSNSAIDDEEKKQGTAGVS